MNIFSILHSFPRNSIWRAVPGKTFLHTKYIFDAAWSCFCRQETLFCVASTFFWLTWNTFSYTINTFLSTPNYFLCNVKIFVSTQNYFSCNTKFLFRASLRMLNHGDIFLLSHSNKNIVTCQKINKFHFYVTQKKLVSFFVHHNFLIFSFHITRCQHVDLHRSGLGNKETFNPSFTHLSDIYRSSY